MCFVFRFNPPRLGVDITHWKKKRLGIYLSGWYPYPLHVVSIVVSHHWWWNQRRSKSGVMQVYNLGKTEMSHNEMSKIPKLLANR